MAHILGTLQGVFITKADDLEDRMNSIVTRLKLTEVGRKFHQFKPIGATGLILLAESHFSVHTYPENSMLFFDLFCCTPNFKESAGVAAAIIAQEFGTDHIEWQLILR